VELLTKGNINAGKREFPSACSQFPGKTEPILVCGLGSLGQQCVVALKEFGVNIVAIEEAPPNSDRRSAV